MSFSLILLQEKSVPFGVVSDDYQLTIYTDREMFQAVSLIKGEYTEKKEADELYREPIMV
ncbi:MAG: hypothetical protein KAW14_12320 [Candidatus Aegiribacteria sp.]|nr:hypothetical protein [Candidatus Aegiribacteria sp.]